MLDVCPMTDTKWKDPNGPLPVLLHGTFSQEAHSLYWVQGVTDRSIDIALEKFLLFKGELKNMGKFGFVSVCAVWKIWHNAAQLFLEFI